MALLKNQSFVHGVTPMYYLFLEEHRQNKFNTILKLTNIEVSKPFIDSLIEIHSFIERVYVDKNYSGLTEEEYRLTHDADIYKPLLVWYQNGLGYNVKELKEIRDDLIISYDVDHDIKLGRLSLNDLLKLPNDALEDNLTIELGNLSVTMNELGEYEDLSEGIERYELFRDNINIGIELIQKRIERVESRSKGSVKLPLQGMWKEICDGVETLDSAFLGEVNGARNEGLYEKMSRMMDKLSTLGIDTTIQKYADVMSNTSYIVGLDKKKYNQRVIPQYETKKRILEKYRVDVISRIDTLKENYQVDMFHF